MSTEKIKTPDLGGAENVEVIEVSVKAGDIIDKEDALVVVESEKASMEIPSPSAGKVLAVVVNEGDTINEGDILLELDIADDAAPVEEKTASPVKQAEQSPALDSQAAKPPTLESQAAKPPTTATRSETITIPDIGGDSAEVIEVCVAAGTSVKEGESLIVLESDKASMEVPAPVDATIIKLLIKEGDTAKTGMALAEIETSGDTRTVEGNADTVVATPETPLETPPETPPEVQVAASGQASAKSAVVNETICVPDIGGDKAEIIEICVAVGDDIAEGDSLIVMESDKASMEVPAPMAGKLISLNVKEGERLGNGDQIGVLETRVSAEQLPMPEPAMDAKQKIQEPEQVKTQHQPIHGMTENRPSGDVYAGPAVRKLAREVGLDLARVNGSGPKGRIQKADVKAFIREALSSKQPQGAVGGAAIPPIPEVDFSRFGDIRTEKMSKLHKITSANMHRNWLNIPHVTAFDEVDISDLEAFRKQLKQEAEKAKVKITPLPFLLKACAKALKTNPKMNSSLHPDGEQLIYKDYVHIGIAVDTPAGLMVPVIRDVDKKTIFELAAETAELAQKAKDRKLKPAEMQGGCFSISSLGGIGGTGFTPIINAPEVAILGVSKLTIKPVWDGEAFLPKKMLPLSLSYDHRVVNGADAGKFFVYLGSILQDFRRLAL